MARKHVEGPQWTVLYSESKLVGRAKVLYWQAKTKLLKGQIIDKIIIEKH